MSARNVTRALARMAVSFHVLAPERNGASYGLFPNADRRRRPIVRLTCADVAALQAEGAIQPMGDDSFALTDAGRARVRREQAEPGEAYVAQHRDVVDRAVLKADGSVVTVRGHDADATLRRLAACMRFSGSPAPAIRWLPPYEITPVAEN